jgi:hypothetical protein
VGVEKVDIHRAVRIMREHPQPVSSPNGEPAKKARHQAWPELGVTAPMQPELTELTVCRSIQENREQ